MMNFGGGGVEVGAVRIESITVKAALRKVREWHRHLPDLQGGLFAAQCTDDEGACVAKRPEPKRRWVRKLTHDRAEIEEPTP